MNILHETFVEQYVLKYLNRVETTYPKYTLVKRGKSICGEVQLDYGNVHIFKFSETEYAMTIDGADVHMTARLNQECSEIFSRLLEANNYSHKTFDVKEPAINYNQKYSYLVRGIYKKYNILQSRTEIVFQNCIVERLGGFAKKAICAQRINNSTVYVLKDEYKRWRLNNYSNPDNPDFIVGFYSLSGALYMACAAGYKEAKVLIENNKILIGNRYMQVNLQPEK